MCQRQFRNQKVSPRVRLLYAALFVATLAGCGFHADQEGNVRMPFWGDRCAIIVDDRLADKLPYSDAGPLDRRQFVNGLDCDVYRW
jgi:hypothetical protein